MSDPTGKVEDLVKVALKEAMEKRKKTVITVGGVPITAADPFPAIFESIIPKPEFPSIRPKPSKAVLDINQEYYSIVTGNRVEPEKDFGVSTFKDYKWHDSIASFIPPINENYVIDTELASDILKAWELDEKVLCYGPTGAGKSSLIEQLCARTGRPFIRINCTGDMDSSMIFGQLTAKDGSTHWVDGAVTEAVKHGAVFAWDEWDVTPPEIAMGLQWLLEDEGKLFLKEMPGSTKDKQVIPHEHFRLVAIGNTQGQGDDTGAHAGTNVQNSATLDRFGTAVFVDYMHPLLEEQMLLKKWGATLTGKAAKELVKLANLVRQGYKAGQFTLTMSPRSLFSICKKINHGSTLKKAFKVVYLNKLNDTQRKVADELFIKIYGTAEI